MLIRKKFEVTKEINRGAFGVIYVARVVAPTRMAIALDAPTKVAIKYEYSGDDVRILRHEAIILNLLNRHQVVGVPRMHWYGRGPVPTFGKAPQVPTFGQGPVPGQVPELGQAPQVPTEGQAASIAKQPIGGRAQEPDETNIEGTSYPCMVMTYYDTTLDQYMTRLKKEKRWNESVVIRIIERVLSILEQIHALYVVHRDLKPDNLMVKDDEVYLIDFGLATFYVDGATGDHISSDTSHRELVGSPLYASYHVHRGETHTRRDDLIQLGYIYLYMLNGGSLPWQDHGHDRGLGQDHGHDRGLGHGPTSLSPGNILHPANQRRKDSKALDQVVHAHPSMHFQQYMKYVYGLAFDEEPVYTRELS